MKKKTKPKVTITSYGRYGADKLHDSGTFKDKVFVLNLNLFPQWARHVTNPRIKTVPRCSSF